MKVPPTALSRFLRALAVALLALAVLPDAARAESAVLQLRTVYRCPGAKSFKVLSCSGSAETDLCDVQSYSQGQPEMLGKSTHQQVMAVLSICHAQTPGESRAQGPPGAGQGEGANGIKVGDAVEVVTGFGWTPAKVVAVRGNSYRVLVNGIQVTKDYPAEVRRLGPASAQDHAQGQYRLGDRVQVNVDGRWIDSKIVTEMGMDYQVALPGNRTAWATSANLRPARAPAAAVATSAGLPPKPGLTSCAGKVEGRYASTGGLGSFTLTFRSGKATMTDVGGNDEVFECWTGGARIYLHKPDAPNLDMAIDVNDDGTLQTPLGEIRKKG